MAKQKKKKPKKIVEKPEYAFKKEPTFFEEKVPRQQTTSRTEKLIKGWRRT